MNPIDLNVSKNLVIEECISTGNITTRDRSHSVSLVSSKKDLLDKSISKENSQNEAAIQKISHTVKLSKAQPSFKPRATSLFEGRISSSTPDENAITTGEVVEKDASNENNSALQKTKIPQVEHIEVKRYSHKTSEIDIDPIQLGNGFLQKSPVEQLESIFECRELNKDEKEQKVFSLVYLASRLKAENEDVKENVFEKLNQLIFAKQETKYKNQFFDILLEFSTYSSAAFLSELARKMSYEQLHELATYIYIRHDDRRVLEKHTFKLFMQEDLKHETKATLFRGATLSSTLSEIHFNVNAGQEMAPIIAFLDQKLEHYSRYYKENLTKEGEHLIEEILKKIYSLKLEVVKPLLRQKIESIIDRFGTQDKNELSESAVTEMLFLRGINCYINHHVNKTSSVKEDQKAKEERKIAINTILGKITKVLQTLANKTEILSTSKDASLNAIVKKYRKQHEKFVAQFMVS